MCKHSKFLTLETCSDCNVQNYDPRSEYDGDEVVGGFVGVDAIDRSAERIGRHTRGFVFREARRMTAKGRHGRGKKNQSA